MPHVLFVVHGMGVHLEEDWMDGVKKELKKAAPSFDIFQEYPLEQWVKLEPVTYDGVFRRVLKDWNQSVDSLSAYAYENQLDVTDLVSWLDDVDETEKNFFWSHVVDVILYRFFKQVRAEVDARVMSQLADGIAQARAAGSGYSVLAHSLGTAVAHNALHLLATQTYGNSTALNPPATRIDNLFTLANVSRVLELESIPVQDSTVKPGPTDSSTTYLNNYYNFRHRFDPIPAFRPFRADWGDGYHYQRVQHFRDWNIHGFTHYLEHPAVHGGILKAIVGDHIGSDELQEKMSAYTDIKLPSECQDLVDEFKAEMEGLADLAGSASPSSLTDVASAMTRTFAATQKALDKCKEKLEGDNG
jgi:hypothetical protein